MMPEPFILPLHPALGAGRTAIAQPLGHRADVPVLGTGRLGQRLALGALGQHAQRRRGLVHH